MPLGWVTVVVVEPSRLVVVSVLLPEPEEPEEEGASGSWGAASFHWADRVTLSVMVQGTPGGKRVSPWLQTIKSKPSFSKAGRDEGVGLHLGGHNDLLPKLVVPQIPILAVGLGEHQALPDRMWLPVKREPS